MKRRRNQLPLSPNDRHLACRLPGRLDSDLHVLSERRQEFHQPPNREIAGAVAHQRGHVRLLDAQNLAGMRLGEAARLDDLVDLQRQLALSNSCSGFGRSRSAKKLPLPTSARALAFLGMLVPPVSVKPLRFGEATSDQLHIRLRRGDPMFGLLQKHVQDIYRLRKIRGIDGPESIAAMALERGRDA